MRSLVVLLSLASVAASASPADAVSAALADAVKIRPITSRRHVRYLSLYHLDARQQAEWGRAIDFWTNSLSTEPDMVRLTRVRSDLLRLDLRDYELPRAVWERLVDPYFHLAVRRRGSRQASQALAPWASPKDHALLATLLRSRAPIVRGDWWLVESSQQIDRKGTGYYDWLRVRNRREFQARVGADLRLADRVKREVRAIVDRSGVTLHNRQLVRYGTVSGAYWVSLDVNASTGKRNALRNLGDDYQHDVEEIYATLPNGLFAFYLADAAGVQQDAAPDFIAANHVAPGNDRRIHVGWTCVSCHVEGIRPIDDWGRAIYSLPLALADPDETRLRRNRRLYLSDLQRWVSRDQADYGAAVLGLTGLTPPQLARSYGRLRASYVEADLSTADVAREAGVSVPVLRQRLQAIITSTGKLDPILAGILSGRRATRREHFEEVFGLLQIHLSGAIVPENKP